MWNVGPRRKACVETPDRLSTPAGAIGQVATAMNLDRPPLDAARAYGATLALVAASAAGGLLVAPYWGAQSVDLLFLPAVLAAAAWFGRGPALLSAVLAALAYNYLFVAPVHTFRIDRADDLLTVVLLLAVAIVVSELASGMRAQARLAAANAARNATIAGFARTLLSCMSDAAIAGVAARELAALFACNAIVLAPGEPGFTVLAREPAGSPLTPSDFAAAAVAFETGAAAGRGAPRLDPADWLFYPVRAEQATLAVAGLARDDGARPVDESREALLRSLLDQVALALARAASEAETRALSGLAERDRLRGALLQSVGHDLRTPLTAIATATAALRAEPGNPGPLATIEAEADRLRRYIGDLLDMARIEAGAVRVRQEPVDLVDAVDAALRDVRPRAQPAVDIPPGLPLVRADPDLLHHILINLLANAERHGGGVTGIVARSEDDAVTLAVGDDGPGLSEDADAMFTRFGRIAGSDRNGGAGLGLAIVKGFADAMGISVDCGNGPDGRGARFLLRFSETTPIAGLADAGAAA